MSSSGLGWTSACRPVVHGHVHLKLCARNCFVQQRRSTSNAQSLRHHTGRLGLPRCTGSHSSGSAMGCEKVWECWCFRANEPYRLILEPGSITLQEFRQSEMVGRKDRHGKPCYHLGTRRVLLIVPRTVKRSRRDHIGSQLLARR